MTITRIESIQLFVKLAAYGSPNVRSNRRKIKDAVFKGISLLVMQKNSKRFHFYLYDSTVSTVCNIPVGNTHIYKVALLLLVPDLG